MKGVVLAGGFGTRLDPLTKVINKHLLPVYDRPMIYYPLECLAKSGIEDVLLVTGGTRSDEFQNLLGSGESVGLKSLAYTLQDEAGGIAHALGLAEDYADGESIVLMLGDNLVENTIEGAVQDFMQRDRGAKILLSPVKSPQSFGVAQFEGERLVHIIEKPTDPPSNLAVVGIYLYDSQVFSIVKTLSPSGRGELEISDVNNAYLAKGQLSFNVLEGWWLDAGEDIDQYLFCCNHVAQYGANHSTR